MGNSAMRCVHGAPMVRVMRTDGKILEYDQPIVASKVLRQHADHLLVHCSPIEKKGEKKSGACGQRRSKLSIIRADQMLAVGQAYLLYPVPPQYRGSFVKSQCCEMSLGTELTSEKEARLLKGSFKGLAWRFRNQRKNLSVITKGVGKVGDTMEGASPLLKLTTPTPSFQMAESDSEDFSASFDESGQRLRPVASIDGATRMSPLAVSGQA